MSVMNPRGSRGEASTSRRLGFVALASCIVIVSACVATGVGVSQTSALPDGTRIDRLVVYKDAGRMEAYAGDELVKTYAVGVGSGGAGPKQFEGDARTPEGEYRIDSRHRSRQFHRFLHVSYPNRADRRRYRELRRAGGVPEGRGIGSAIGVHGQPSHAFGFLVRGNWTAGCIAVTNDEIEELYAAVVPNARISIRP